MIGSRDHEVRDGVGGAWPAERTGRRRHRGVGSGIVEQSRGVDQRISIERLVIDQPAGAGIDELTRVGGLMPCGMGVRHDDDRQPERRHFRERRGSRPPDHEVRGREGGQHVLAQEREGR